MKSSMAACTNRSMTGVIRSTAAGDSMGCNTRRNARNSGGSISAGMDFCPTFFLGGITSVSAEENVSSSVATRRISS